MSEQTIPVFAAEHGLTMTCERAETNPHMADMPVGSTHWLCTLACDGQTMRLHFSQGPAHMSEPEIATVLDCVASDIASVRNAPDWLDWAEEMGAEMEAESLRQLRASHETITRQAEELEALIGFGALETLLWNTERL